MVEQKHLSPVMILASIIFMSTFVPLSIDLYLPALPWMREYFQASEMLVNMTLIAFFLGPYRINMAGSFFFWEGLWYILWLL